MALLLSAGLLWKTAEHPNKGKYPNQKVFLVPVDGYIYFVPYVIEGDTIFLKTAFPHRKATRDYLRKGKRMNKEEKILADAYDRGELALGNPSDELLQLLAEAGENTFKKDKGINIRLSGHDLIGIQRKAAQKGIPYQAFISGLIHQYVEGELQETGR